MYFDVEENGQINCQKYCAIKEVCKISQSRLIIVKLGGLMSHKFSIEPLEIKNVKKFMVRKNNIDLETC